MPTTTIIPSDDAFVDSYYPNNKDGLQNFLLVGQACCPNWYMTFLRFPLSNIQGDIINRAYLYMSVYAGTTGSYTFAIYDITDRTWSEGTITYATRPAVNSAYPNIQFTRSYTSADFSNQQCIQMVDLTSYIQDQINAGKATAEFAIWPITQPLYASVRFHSKEYSTTPCNVSSPGCPGLYVDYTVTPADITATNMIICSNPPAFNVCIGSQVTNCVGPCTVYPIVTWQNMGGTAGTFTPSITVDGVVVATDSPQTLNPGQTYTNSYTLNLGIGNHVLCPVPN